MAKNLVDLTKEDWEELEKKFNKEDKKHQKIANILKAKKKLMDKDIKK